MQLDLRGIDVQILVVDNNSTDQTQQVLDSFRNRLPLVPLFERKQGKNQALNRGLDYQNLGDVVVFTDDDVDVDARWLLNIADVVTRWPGYSVFGGMIEVAWPVPRLPGWVDSKYVRSFGYSEHRYRESEVPYESPVVPFGPNFWVRREVIANRRFNPDVDIHTVSGMLGDETLFLSKLAREGFPALYSPLPKVHHRIEEKTLTTDWIYQRALQLGRGTPHVRGLPREQERELHPRLWVVRRHFSLWLHRCIASALATLPQSDTNVLRRIGHLRDTGINVEALSIHRQQHS
jgi:glycosyltransferase involved in cell wall biosynthesis